MHAESPLALPRGLYFFFHLTVVHTRWWMMGLAAFAVSGNGGLWQCVIKVRWRLRGGKSLTPGVVWRVGLSAVPKLFAVKDANLWNI
jgi:hypothetical protein